MGYKDISFNNNPIEQSVEFITKSYINHKQETKENDKIMAKEGEEKDLKHTYEQIRGYSQESSPEKIPSSYERGF